MLRPLFARLVVVVALVATVQGCGHGRVLVAAGPSAGTGVRVQVVGPATLDGATFSVGLQAFNDTDWKIEINRNQIALVAPDGREFFREGGREIHWLEPHGRHAINIDMRVEPDAFAGAPGAYLRFDGFYAGKVRIDVPPMALGKPSGSAGKPDPRFTAQGDGKQTVASAPSPARAAEKAKPEKSKPGMFRRLWNAARGDDASDDRTATASAAAPAPDASVQQYDGPRRQIRAIGTKCAAMPFKTKGVAAQMTFVMDELLLSELQQSGFEAIGPDDINALIGFEKTKQAVGCDEMTCMSEIGNALGVQYLAAGSAAVIEGSVVLTLKLIDTRGPRVVARVNEVTDAGQKGMPRLIAEGVLELVERSGL